MDDLVVLARVRREKRGGEEKSRASSLSRRVDHETRFSVCESAELTFGNEFMNKWCFRQ